MSILTHSKNPPLPNSLHWLGEREVADATQHATDLKGCVMYFDTQSECIEFMNWLTKKADEKELDRLLEQNRKLVAAMTPEQKSEMIRKQAEGWAKSEAQWAKDFREGKTERD